VLLVVFSSWTLTTYHQMLIPALQWQLASKDEAMGLQWFIQFVWITN